MDFQRFLDNIKRHGNKVATFLKTREVVTFLFFLLLAFGLWYMHSAGTQRELRDTLKIKYVGIPNDVRFDNQLPDKVTFVIQDEGRQLWEYRSQKHDAVVIDLSSQFLSGSRIEIEFEKQLQKMLFQLYPSTKVIELTPGYFVSDYVRLKSKVVPVRLSEDVRLAPQHVLSDKVKVHPSEITIYGDQASLDSTECVMLESVGRELSASEKIELRFILPDGIDVSEKTGWVDVPVEMCTEKELDVPIVKKNVPVGLMVRTFPSVARVKFSVGLSRYNLVKSEAFEVVFDYDKAVADSDETNELELVVKSENVSNVQFSPNEVEYVIERAE